jgi:nucleoid-associated protein YgaU
LARILKQDFFSGWRTAVPFILFALIGGELLGALPVAKPAPAFGGELHNEQPRQALDDRAVEISPADAAARIAKERADAQSQSLKGLEVEVRWKAEQEAAETADADARKRQQAEELARRKAESDKIISEELENLKKAREEADRAKAAKRKAETPDSERAQMTAKRASRTKAASATGVHGRCASGRVVYRKGRRWYVTGADDTLWQIAKRFYGSGSAYPRIYRANRKRLASPNIVRPCLALRLPGRG